MDYAQISIRQYCPFWTLRHCRHLTYAKVTLLQCVLVDFCLILEGGAAEVAKLLPSCTWNALSGCAEELRSGVATVGTSEKEFTMGAEGASRKWRWAMELIIVHLSEAASRSCASPASHTEHSAQSHGLGRISVMCQIRSQVRAVI